jgi:hypothetical protein
MTIAKRIAGLSQQRFAIIALFVGLLIGALTVVDVRLPVLAVCMVAFGLFALSRPFLTVPLVFSGILLEEIGRIDVAIAGLPLTVSKLAVLAMMGVWLIRAVVERKPLVTPLAITPGMLVVALSMFAGIAVAGKVGPAQVMTVLSFCMVCVLTHLVSQLVPVSRLVWLIRIMGIIALGVMFVQMGKDPVETALDERYAGAFLDPNFWAMTLLLFTPLCFAVYAEEKGLVWLGVLVIMAIMVPANILQSLSRAGLIAALIVLPTIVYVARRRWWVFAIALALVPFVIGSFVSVEAMIDRYNTLLDPAAGEADGSMLQRAELAETAFLLFKENLLVGIGQANFIEQAIERTNGNAHLIAHNTYLNIAAELGLVGIVAHIYFFALVTRQGVLAFFRSPTRRLQGLILGYAVGMLSFALMSATLNTISFPMAYFVLGIGMVLDRASHMNKAQLTQAGLGDDNETTVELDGQDLVA